MLRRGFSWGLLLLLVLEPFAALADSSLILSSAADVDPAAVSLTHIYIARRGWHIDIGFAVTDLQSPLKGLAREFSTAEYLFFGFGDKRYLLSKNHNAPVLLTALWPGRGMILMTALAALPETAFGTTHVVVLDVMPNQNRAAQAYIWRSMDHEPAAADNSIKPYANGPYEGSLYFLAVPRYSAIHTCNTWVAESLRAASLPIHSAGVLFAGQLWRRVKRLELTQASHFVHQQGGLVPSWQTTVVPEF